MSSKLQFREKLSGILQLAEEQGKRITTEEVELYFEEDHLTKEQIELVYDYLLSQKIVVKGYEKTGGTIKEKEEQPVAYTKEEQVYLETYLSDLSAIRLEEDGERQKLYREVLDQDALAKARLVEIYLPEVVEIAKTLHHPDVFLGDMIQEGNVSLMLAMDFLDSAEHAHEQICTEIRQGMQALVEEHLEAKRQDHKMVEQVNNLDETIKGLTEDLGRKITIEELSLHLEMPEQEILNVLKLAGEDLEEEEKEEDFFKKD